MGLLVLTNAEIFERRIHHPSTSLRAGFGTEGTEEIQIEKLRELRACVVKTFLHSAEDRAEPFFYLRGLHARNANQFLAAGFSGGYRN